MMEVVAPELWLGDDGIMRLDYGHSLKITYDSIVEAHKRSLEITNKRCPVLLRGNRVGEVDHEAQQFASHTEICARVTALAILANTFLEKHLGNLFLLYHRPPYPTKLFTSEEAALSWLKQFIDTAGG